MDLARKSTMRTVSIKLDGDQLFENEEYDIDDGEFMVKERVFVPVVWCRLPGGFRIQELKETYYDEALRIMKVHFMTEDVLCKAAALLDDFLGRKLFLKACSFQMRSTTSLVAIEELNGKDQMVGICLLRAVARFDFGRVFSRTIIRQGEPYNKYIEIKNDLSRKVDIYADYDCEIFLRVYSVCVKSKYRGKGIGFALLGTSFRIARALKIPIIMGIFDCYKMQEYAKMLGFFVVSEINYSEWKDRLGFMIFPDIDPKNKSCALMLAKVEPELYPEFLIEKAPPPEDKEDKKKKKKGKKGDKKGKKKKGKK